MMLTNGQDPEEEALRRFRSIYDALESTNIESAPFRAKILSAYGLKTDPSRDTDAVAESELEFAQNCLSGKGSDTNQMVYDHHDLRSVLAIEIGILPPERGNDGHPLKRRQWLGGDWISMANLIIENSECALHGSKERKLHPIDLIRLWPIKTGSWQERTSIQFSKLHKTSVSLHKTSDSSSEPIYLLHDPDLHDQVFIEDHKWISLPLPPNKLWEISNIHRKSELPGIPANLWTSFPQYFERHPA